MTLPSFAPLSAWLMLLSGILGSNGVLGQSTAVSTSLQYDPHFMGWYIGPATSENPNAAQV